MHNHVVKYIREEEKKLKSFQEARKDGQTYKQIYNGVNIKEKPSPSHENHMLGGLCYTCKLYTYTTNINLVSVQ